MIKSTSDDHNCDEMLIITLPIDFVAGNNYI